MLFKVAGEVRHWEEGKAMLLDDSFPHEAWNYTDEIQVVFFLDIVRPIYCSWSWFDRAILKRRCTISFCNRCYK